ncbi:MAG: aminomethyl-transferring glycine dehydrogenase subunit GcvPA [Acidithiobacillus sp.]|uniref:aminomethyl-transferring glycine dehydrogenase subunit GcvPA n=1 Tax=Acidithiobacillus sp. TaxID=1872118 RepID=UPI003D060700
MPYIPHDEEETAAMLAAIGVDRIDALFDEIPQHLQTFPQGVPEGLSEMALAREFEERAAAQPSLRSFAGAGAYAHHIPAVVPELIGRGEFYSAYTPYQAEASQGTLQVIFEFQTYIARLTGMEVANASLYDGASALFEACLMALRLRPQQRSILVPRYLLPHWREVLDSLLPLQDVRCIELDADPQRGTVRLPAQAPADAAALIIPQINALGLLEDVDALQRWATDQGLLSIAVVQPLSLALLREPGGWGESGADIVVGEAQALGIPLNGGGPYCGLFACRRDMVRQMPGRLVARTQDAAGRVGYCLTLQAREQHIRRGQATSNVCTNQGLMVTAATIALASLGAYGLREAAVRSHRQARSLLAALLGLQGVRRPWEGPFFNEFVVRFPMSAVQLRDALLADGILAGVPLAELGLGEDGDLLIAVTERVSDEDIDDYRAAVGRILEQ